MNAILLYMTFRSIRPADYGWCLNMILLFGHGSEILLQMCALAEQSGQTGLRHLISIAVVDCFYDCCIYLLKLFYLQVLMHYAQPAREKLIALEPLINSVTIFPLE